MISLSNRNQMYSQTQSNQNHQADLPFLRPVTSEEFIPSTNRWISIAGFVLTGSVAIAAVMAYTIEYNITVKAAGIVRPVGELRLVQPEIEGVVKSILVKENQSVRQGQVIAELDDTQQQIKKSQLQGTSQQTNLQIGHMTTQIQSLNTQIAAEEQSIARGIAAAEADLARNQREYADKRITTQSELLAAEAQLQKEQADLQKAQANLAFAEDERSRYQMLVTAGAIAQNDFNKKTLTVNQNKAEVVSVQKTIDIAIARRKSAQTNLNPSNAMVSIARQRIAQEQAKGAVTIATLKKEKQSLMQRSIELASQLNQTRKELEQLAVQLQKNTIKATSDGIILKLDLRNTNQVLRSGETVAQIIPQNSPLVIKAMVPTTDVGKVAIGQKVQLRVEACSYPDYGTLKGTVTSISPDLISPSTNNLAATTTQPSGANHSYFEAVIKPENLTFGQTHRLCQIQAGMEVKADIISRTETALQFLFRKARLITDL